MNQWNARNTPDVCFLLLLWNLQGWNMIVAERMFNGWGKQWMEMKIIFPLLNNFICEKEKIMRLSQFLKLLHFFPNYRIYGRFFDKLIIL